MIRLDWKLTLIKQINQSLDSEPSEFNGTNLTNFRSIKFVGKIDYNNQIYLYSLNEKGAPGFDLINPIIICLLYTSPSPRDVEESRMPSSA